MEDPLRWWAANEHHFPTLSSLVRRYQAIQATSIPSEHMFSDAGTTVDRKRCALDPDNVDHLVFLHKNMSYNYMKKHDLYLRPKCSNSLQR